MNISDWTLLGFPWYVICSEICGQLGSLLVWNFTPSYKKSSASKILMIKTREFNDWIRFVFKVVKSNRFREHAPKLKGETLQGTCT